MSIGEKFATKNEVEVLRRKLQLALSGATIVQIESEETGVANFTDLADVPPTYAAAGNWVVRVKSTVDELEFAALLGTTNQVYVAENAADFTLSLPQNIHTAATPTFAGLYLESDTIAPFLKMTNESNVERDPIHQWSVGATPAIKFTHGVDDSDSDNLKWCNTDALVDTVLFNELSDDLFVSDTTNARIHKRLKTTLAHVLHLDDGTSPLFWGMCCDGDYVYVVDVGGHTVEKYQASDLTLIASAGKIGGGSGNGDGEFSSPRDVCTDGVYLYVADYANYRIQKLLKDDLSFVAKAGSAGAGDDNYNFPIGICTDGYHCWVSDSTNYRIKKILCSDLSYVSKIGSNGTGNDQFNYPVGICTDGTHVYVADINNDRIVKRLCSDLSYVSEQGSNGIGNNEYIQPAGATTDGTHVWVSEVGNNRIKKILCSDLSYVSKIGSTGTGNDQFNYPYGICVAYIPNRVFGKLLVLHQDGSYFDVYPKLSLYNSLIFREDSVAEVEYVEIKSPTSIVSYTLILPGAAAGAKKHLYSGATGILDWGQNVDTDSGPTFDHLHLSATSNQIVLQSAGVTGTITATPASSNKVWTLQDFTGTIYQTGGTDVAVADGGTNKSSWTLYAIPYASGTTTIGEIAIGAAGKVLAVNGGANGYEWIAAGGGGTFLTLTDVDEPNYTGHAGHFVVVDGDEDALIFSASSVAAHNILSATHSDTTAASPVAGDILYADATPKWTKRAKGTNGHVLTLVSGLPDWAAAAGGGTHSLWFPDAFPASPTSQSDHFDDASLDAKWHEFDTAGKVVISEADHHVKFAITSLINNHAGMWQTLPSGDFTITAKMRTEYAKNLEAKYMYWGITLFQDATNNPSTCDILIFHVYQYNNTVTSQVLYWTDYDSYSSTVYAGPTIMVAPFQAIYFRVRRNGTDFYYDLSLDNLSWKQYVGPIAQGAYFTPAEFGITCYQESGAEQYVYCDWIYYQASDNFLASAIGASISI